LTAASLSLFFIGFSRTANLWDGGSCFQHAQKFIRCKHGRPPQFLILIADLRSL
jgi:hypothetical protein